ncbi:hypothetical protein SteCoe_33192 [Stentor coeruleus]|uniref:F-box domain-containing protein n=1 Tax=Stentor coeruleus TaxID=5963 RepID=A0A1R2AX92_9CILI|nr:hypothetical protein SteCoe_33192 [Stentor coeruleus]
MDWKKLGFFKNLNRFDVWQHIFAYLDTKTVIDGLSKSCKSFKMLSLMHISHLKNICILSLKIDSKTSYNNLIELIKCEKTFLLKIRSNLKSPEIMNSPYTNKSIIRLKYTSENGIFSPVLSLLKTVSCFNHFSISGNSSLPAIPDNIITEMLRILNEKKIVFFKISKITLNNKTFKKLVHYIKSRTPKDLMIDITCFSNKAIGFQNYLYRAWKDKWLLTVDYKLNGKVIFNCTRGFLE